ncbi:hypothetical protein [Streptomyces xanthii]|uniref:Uncharacterized protein n=1 Tax=Streptomyces xanthii TaxID=2768069 RepID=A0A7H1B4W3_9ACTN|nr:hypothetical protein [Streptomyces xanthii]QNS03768.1 hypothetical protein IAG42_09110 [Streptomyces xanthii]
MKHYGDREPQDSGVRLGDRSEELAALNDRSRGLTTTLVWLLAFMIGASCLALLGVTMVGTAARVTPWQVGASVLGLVADGGVVILLVRSRRRESWLLLLGAGGLGLACSAVMAFAGTL